MKHGKGFVVVPIRRGPCKKCKRTGIAIVLVGHGSEQLMMRLCGQHVEDFVRTFGTKA